MSDRRRGHALPRDADGAPLIDTGVLIGMLGMTHAGARKWATRHGIHHVRNGAHGARLYRLDDVQRALRSGQITTLVSSETQAGDVSPLAAKDPRDAWQHPGA